ncbi:MAG: YIP1 family protein [Saprospiraceae bacterium]|nr:YIP1 family protein [Saprospiraceae bacterium]
MNLFNTLLKLLTFRLTREEMMQFNRKHFIVGLVGTWVVGMGRYWDDSGANWMQHLGLGSVIYIFVLALFIWVILLPFKIKDWSYFIVLTFIGLTSFPAIFYAIPVEKFLSIETSNTINVWFLAIVAAWRLALLYYFLKHFTRLSRGNIITVTLMPICIIISVLTLLNLHRVVFNIMGGMRNPTPHDSSYLVLMLLTGVSLFLSIPLLIAYGVGIYNKRKELNLKSKEEMADKEYQH